MKKLTIVTSDSCAGCHTLIGDLVRENIDFTELNADGIGDHKKIIALGVGMRGMPTIVIKDQNNVIQYYNVGYSKKIVDEIIRELK